MDLDKHALSFKRIYDHGVLVPDQDYLLVTRLEEFCKTAGIQPHFVYRTMTDFVDEDDVGTDPTNGVISWMRGYKGLRRRKKAGCCLVGVKQVITKMSAMVGCAMRNYIDARLMTVQQVLDLCKYAEGIPQDFVTVPNFHVSYVGSTTIPNWYPTTLLGWLYSRYSEGKITALYVDNMTALETAYGLAMVRFITENYDVIEEK